VMFSPVIGVLWVFGLVRLLRRPDWVRVRPLAIAFLVVLLVFLVAGGKGYYLAGLIPPLIAAGCTDLAERWSTRGVTIAGVVLVASAAVAYPAVVPVVPASTFANSVWSDMNDVQLDTIGWPDYTGQVRAVVDDLSPEERRTAVIFTSNYGEAGAMSWYDVGLPVYSGHNGYRNWGPPADDAVPVVLVLQGSPAADFEGCELKGRLRNGDDTDNEEVGAGIWVCDGPRGSWSEAWEGLGHYDA
jgi:hypothetical protein